MFYCIQIHLISSHLSPLTSEVVGAPQMTLQQYLSTLPCLPLPSGNLQTPFPSIPWSYLPISSSVFLPFLLHSLSPQYCDLIWDLIVSVPDHCLSFYFVFAMSEDLEMWPKHLGFHFFIMVRRSSCTPVHSGFCFEPPRSSHGLCRKCSEVSYSISSQGLGSFSRFLLSRSSSHRHKGR